MFSRRFLKAREPGVAGLLWALAVLPGAANAGSVAVPQPFLCMYGHFDGAGVTDAFREFIPPFNVIEGTSTDADFIKELRASGRIYAAHVNNSASSTSNDLLNAWRAPFDNTLGGQLPGGYDAIAIDELLAASTDGTTQSDSVIWALQQLRALYPDKLVFVAAVWQYAQNAASYTDQLNAVYDYTDMLMLEKYMREGNLSYRSASYADNLKAVVPGILSKTVFGLSIAQHGHVMDERSHIGFWGMLDEQFHRINNDADASTMPGMMFWAYYRSESELTPDYCARLCDHYYIQSNTTYFSDGNTAQLIANPGFEGGTGGWVLTPGSGGSVAQFTISAEGIRDNHSSDPIRNQGQGPTFVPHDLSGLKMVRGSTYNKASYQIAVDTSMTYTVSAWAFANQYSTRAKVTITEADDTPIASEEITHANPDDYARMAFNFAPPSSPIKIVLNDESTAAGRTLYWDFIELEEAFVTPLLASSPPLVDNGSGATGVTHDAAWLTGNLLSTNPSSAEVYVYWGTNNGGTNASSWYTNEAPGTLASGPFSVNITGLDSNTVHYYRCYATNSGGIAWASSSEKFTTIGILPFCETFEDLAPGDIDWQNGWRVSTSDAAIVQTAVTYGGSARACSISNAVLTHEFSDTRATNIVWVEAAMQPVLGNLTIPPGPEGHTANLSFSHPDGYVMANDGINCVVLSNKPTVVVGEWTRFSIRIDYSTKKWDLWMNGTNMFSGFGFYNPGKELFSKIRLSGGPGSASHLDDVKVSTNTPAGLIFDDDTDGLDDDWEVQHFGSTNVSSGGPGEDWDNDGFIDLHEFLAGTDPTDPDSLLIIKNARHEPGSRLIITWHSASNKTYLIRRGTNFITPWAPLISNILAVPPLNVHTVTTESTPEYYQIELE